MSQTLACSNCRAPIHPTGRAARVRCEFCGADNLIDGLTRVELASARPAAPGIGMSEILGSLAAHRSDAGAFIEDLAKRLAAALPDRVEVKTAGGFFSRAHVVAIHAELAAYRYSLELSGSRLVGRRAHSVRGVTLKNEQLTAGEFVEALAAELYELSREGEESRAALERFMGG